MSDVHLFVRLKWKTSIDRTDMNLLSRCEHQMGRKRIQTIASNEYKWKLHILYYNRVYIIVGISTISIAKHMALIVSTTVR